MWVESSTVPVKVGSWVAWSQWRPDKEVRWIPATGTGRVGWEEMSVLDLTGQTDKCTHRRRKLNPTRLPQVWVNVREIVPGRGPRVYSPSCSGLFTGFAHSSHLSVLRLRGTLEGGGLVSEPEIRLSLSRRLQWCPCLSLWDVGPLLVSSCGRWGPLRPLTGLWF